MVLPEASVAMLVTVVTPIGKVEPLAGVETRLVTKQLSSAVTEKVTLLRPQEPTSAVNTRLVGQVIVGAFVSPTATTVCEMLEQPFVSITNRLNVKEPALKASTATD